MAAVRKKRNFKGLQLNDAPSPQSSSPQDASHPSSSGTTGPHSGRGTGTTTSTTLTSASSSTTGSSLATHIEPSSGANYHNTLTEQLKNLELGVEYKLDLKNEDLRVLSELGSGNGGTVTKVLHEKSGTIMAKKTVFIDAKPAVRKQIIRELQILHECNSPYIVSFYGAYLSEPHICMCMEYADKSSLDGIWRKWGPIPADICGQVALTVVKGLTYLYDVHRIIHRDVKPSNILVNSQGQIKLCDFGVSGELINSIADTFVGTSTYMSPERIQGDQYSVKSDVWSLGITIIEIALGRFPFAESSGGGAEEEDEEDDEDLRSTLSPNSNPHQNKSNGGSSDGTGGSGSQMSMLELLQRIVNEPPPLLPPTSYTSSSSRSPASKTRRKLVFPLPLREFVKLCVTKEPKARPTPKELEGGAFIREVEAKEHSIDVKRWVDTLV